MTTALRAFTRQDWQCFAGCESENPLIGEESNLVVVVDDYDLCVNYQMTDDDEWPFGDNRQLETIILMKHCDVPWRAEAIAKLALAFEQAAGRPIDLATLQALGFEAVASI